MKKFSMVLIMVVFAFCAVAPQAFSAAYVEKSMRMNEQQVIDNGGLNLVTIDYHKFNTFSMTNDAGVTLYKIDYDTTQTVTNKATGEVLSVQRNQKRVQDIKKDDVTQAFNQEYTNSIPMSDGTTLTVRVLWHWTNGELRVFNVTTTRE